MRFALMDDSGDYYAGECLDRHGLPDTLTADNLTGAVLFTLGVRGGVWVVWPEPPGGEWTPVAVRVGVVEAVGGGS